MTRELEYKVTIDDQAGYEIFDVVCDHRGIHIGEADSIKKLSFERHQFDQLVAAVQTYDKMMEIAKPLGAGNA